MIADVPLTLIDTQYRLACYYLRQLQMVDAILRKGHENTHDALALFDREWSQIKYWQAWAAARSNEDPKVARLCMDFARAGEDILLLREQPREWLVWVQTGLQAAILLEDRVAEKVHLFLLSRIYLNLALLDDSLRAVQVMLLLAEQQGDLLYQCKGQLQLSTIYYMTDDYDLSRETGQRALDLARAISAKSEYGKALNGLGNVALSQSDNQLAYEYYTQFLAHSEALGLQGEISVALFNIGLVLMRLGDLETGVDYVERCIALCREIGNERFLMEGLGLRGSFALAQQDLALAEDYWMQSLALARARADRWNEANVLMELGYLKQRLGDMQAGFAFQEESIALSAEIGERWFGALAYRDMTLALVSMGDLERARQKIREGLVLALPMKSSAIRAKYLLVAAFLWCAQGHIEQAALWSGLLQVHQSKLSAEQRRELAELMAQLECHMTSAELQAAQERGKTLDLNGEIETVVRCLDGASELST